MKSLSVGELAGALLNTLAVSGVLKESLVVGAKPDVCGKFWEFGMPRADDSAAIKASRVLRKSSI